MTSLIPLTCLLDRLDDLPLLDVYLFIWDYVVFLVPLVYYTMLRSNDDTLLYADSTDAGRRSRAR